MSEIFTDAMLENATLTGEQEDSARRGYCPGCKERQLRHFNSDCGMVFKQCAECGTVVVLARIDSALEEK